LQSELVTQELIRLCICIYYSKHQFQIATTNLQKILYKTKMSLPENNPVRESLPFYWYKHGPFSEYVSDIKQKMIVEGKIVEENERFVATTNRIVEHDDNIKLARKNMIAIINDSSNNSQRLMDEIYHTDAPCGFYLSFKSNFSAAVYNFLNDPKTNFKPEDLIDILENSMGDLPNDSIFRSFKYSLRDFVELFSEIIQTKSVLESVDPLLNIIDEIFNTFANGIRIRNHDEFYDSKAEQWKVEFDESVSNLNEKADSIFKEYKQNLKHSPFVTFEELLANILDLRSKDALIMTSFISPDFGENLNYGRIDAELFNDKNDDQFRELLYNFKNSRNAVVHYLKKDELETTNYKLITS